MIDIDLDELRSELDEFAVKKKVVSRSPREERIIAGFEEIERFVEEHGHLPRHGEEYDIFERLYAVRLDKMRTSEECRTILEEFDNGGLLSASIKSADSTMDDIDNDALARELTEGQSDITQLKHVKTRAEKKAAEEIAQRTPCEDFETFKPLFEAVQNDIKSGLRVTHPFKDDASIKAGDFFILAGQKAYVANVGEEFITDYDRPDRRLRVIYDNGTESDILMRSLQRALNRDEAGRRIIELDALPLFTDEAAEDDVKSGTIYVLRSKSDEPYLKENRDVIHKIGVTGGDIKKRFANAKNDPTFLMAEVEVVATYELSNINRHKMEKLIHTFFNASRLDFQITDRFGKPISPREWFLVPVFVIDEFVDLLRKGKVDKYCYDANKATIVELESS